MKKLIIASMLLGSLFALSPAYSQQGPAHKERAQGRELDFTTLKTDLGLSDAQVASWKALEAQHKTKAEELRKNTSLTDEEKRIKMKELRILKDGEVKKILTDEQYSKFISSRPTKGGK